MVSSANSYIWTKNNFITYIYIRNTCHKASSWSDINIITYIYMRIYKIRTLGMET